METPTRKPTALDRARKKRYVPDLVSDMAECDANYIRLLRLFPGMSDADAMTFGVTGTTNDGTVVTLAILERCPYTTVLSVTVANDADKPWIRWPSLEVRVYHDLNTAEVIRFERHKRFRYRYETPNPDLFQPDEKSQINRFFGELLAFFLRNGKATDPVCLSSR